MAKLTQAVGSMRTGNKVGSNKGILARHVAERVARADARREARAKRSNEEQLALIATRPGASAKEVARLSI